MNSSRQIFYRWNELRGKEQFNESEAPWIIFFHGYGANCMDLFPLSELIPTRKPWNWLFPQGPVEIPLGASWMGRAWWNLDLEKIQMAMQSGNDRDTGLEIPPNLPLLREKIFKMISDLKVPWSKIVLGGFSQGGMVAMDLAFNAPENPRALVVMSSSAVNQKEWSEISAKRKGLRFYQSHGTQDPVLSYKNAQRLENFLIQQGLKGKMTSFQGVHEIPTRVLQEIGGFLDSVEE